MFGKYYEGVPSDIVGVEYGKINRAHQLTQGRKGPGPPCTLIDRGCQQKDSSKTKATATSLACTLDGSQVYMCTLCCQSWQKFVENHSEETLQANFNELLVKMQDRHYTERYLSLDVKGSCEACNNEEVIARVFFNLKSKVVCRRCSQQWRSWCGLCDWRTLITSVMDEEECEEVWTEFVNHIADHDKEVELSKQRRAKGHCVACPATFETTKMRSLPEDFFPNEVKEDDVICTQCLTWFSSDRTRKLYDWQNLQDFIDGRAPIYEESTENAAIRAASKLCVCSTDENPVEGTVLMKILPWLDRHPKLCRDCAGFWRSCHYKKSHIWTTYDFSTHEKFTGFLSGAKGNGLRLEKWCQQRDEGLLWKHILRGGRKRI